MRFFAVTLFAIYGLGAGTSTSTLRKLPADLQGQIRQYKAKERHEQKLKHLGTVIDKLNAHEENEENLIEFKAALKGLHIPDDLIEKCLKGMGLNENTVGKLMRISSAESDPDDIPYLNYELNTLMTLRDMYGGRGIFEDCLQKLEGEFYA